ncbi:MAG: Asp-tRNA(Asn)/Glu-tRNA(Gln) amidotransferase GatCAB subunit B, partial [Bryobacterales bacterium]|nr:Asp-tRNA(Asn)/Glu-tRNA(Gln) amidotransferase GatCAB subunit B [Bryobacterales bacterium]
PDLVPLRIGAEWLARVVSEMPELPQAKRARFPTEYGLRPYDADVLTFTRENAEFYEQAATASKDPKAVANWVMGDLAAMLKSTGKEIADSPIPPRHIAELVDLIGTGELSGKLAKEIFPKMFETGDAPKAIMEREGLKQISDTGALEKIIDDVIANNPKQVEQYKGGKTTVIGFLVGAVMKASRGQANPAAVNQLMAEKLK